ncbi:Polyphosphate:AMP phosphotransferase [Candidatus Nitrososphaera evergladensis SR1]|uniref:Polyphosphate:AMP phosphotransferase n=1 Tax=Candidatus Nitrososphaera evergladensis SR1 TaxID=1459636 RepID=A0A075MP24_9ARCH|nr:ADP-polyphosphate phosphotransferase [Candidatus Nitrososphaera evergladensis]AIF82552.1 Polyphosphate:AMP phosphotransferase [Candidatus Nitrososphaera evergladensis SR1]
MKINSEDFIVSTAGRKKVNLKHRPTIVKPLYGSKKQYKEILNEHIEELSSLQELLFASNRYSLLVIFEGMDAAGKDSAIKHVMSGVNPQGCQVFSFKRPTPIELQHDFLWRYVVCLPERGRIGIFNRSYYEGVLAARVHPEVDLRSEGFLDQDDGPAADEEKKKEEVWEQRYESIVNLEKHLYHNGTRIIKIFLHLSEEEQRKRFLERIDDPKRNWKFSLADVEERKFWHDYMKAYEDCLSATSTTTYAPWYVVPADNKENARLIISEIILETLNGLEMSYPKLDPKRLDELQSTRKKLLLNK